MRHKDEALYLFSVLNGIIDSAPVVLKHSGYILSDHVELFIVRFCFCRYYTVAETKDGLDIL